MRGNDSTEVVTELNRVLELWPFFFSSLQVLARRTNDDTTPEKMMAELMRIVSKYPHNGVVLVRLSKSGKPFGFVAARDNSTEDLAELLVSFAYIDERCPEKIKELQESFELWAKIQGYESLLALSPKMMSHKFFENRLGFRRAFLGYRKTL